VFLLQQRSEDAVPLLHAALAEAEAEATPRSYRIAVRADALAQALWESGGTKERDRARSLVAQARTQYKIARLHPDSAHLVDTIDRTLVRLDAWERSRPR
jgi:hypothetical protein